jgi:hypothetical protein
MEERQPSICNKCGGPGGVLVHEYVEKTHYYESLSCECGKAGAAAERIYDKCKRYRQVGDLGQGHPMTWRTENPELIEEWEEEQRMYDDEFCGDCFTVASLDDWEREEWEPKIRPEDEKWNVYCMDCYKENTTKQDSR